MKKYILSLSLILTSSIFSAENNSQSAVASLIKQGKVEYAMEELEKFAEGYNREAYFTTILKLEERFQRVARKTVPGINESPRQVADPLLFANTALYSAALKEVATIEKDSLLSSSNEDGFVELTESALAKFNLPKN